MSLIPALEESDKSAGHGWTTSSRFSLDDSYSAKDSSPNLYSQLISQNNTGNVPEAHIEEEVMYESDPGNANQQSTHNNVSHTTHSLQGQVNTVQSQSQGIQQQPQQQQAQVQIQQQQRPAGTQQRQLNFQQKGQGNVQRQIGVSNPGAGKQAQKVVYAVVSQQGNQVQGAGQKVFQQKRQNVQQGQPGFQQQQQLLQSKVYQAPENSGEGGGEDIDTMIQLNEQKIEAFNKQLAEYGLPVHTLPLNSQGSVQITNSPQLKSCDYVGMVRVPNNSQQALTSQEAQNSVRQLLMMNKGQQQTKVVMDNNGANVSNQVRTVVQRPGGPGIPGSVAQVSIAPTSRPKVFGQVEGNQSNNTSLTSQVVAASTSPVQVPSVSTNLRKGVLESPNPNINTNNVTLEGGGQFEENQAYVIRDTKGNSRTMIWKGGQFHPLSGDKQVVQHSVIDSSQNSRGRGRGNRGRGKGQLRGNATGVNMVMRSPSQTGPRLNRMPALNNVRSPNIIRQSLNAQARANRPFRTATPGHVPQEIRTQVVHPQIVQSGSQGAQQVVPGQVRPVLNKTSLQNLMPAAKVTQKPGTSNSPRQTLNTEGQDGGEGSSGVASTQASENKTDSEETKTENLDLPNVPSDPNAVAVCQFCGYTSVDKLKCESCNRKFTSATKYYLDNSNKDDPQQKRRKLNSDLETKPGVAGKVVTLDKKAFYGQKIEEQNKLYTQVFSGNNTIIAIPRNPRGMKRSIVIRGGRGRGRAGKVVVPETVTISSDEEEGGPSKTETFSSPCTPISKVTSADSQSPCSADQECPESPLIPTIPISNRIDRVSRVDKMENESGMPCQEREKSVSPVEVMLEACSVFVGTFRGVPVEPILMSKSGISFFIEGVSKSHRFHIYPQEIQQCLAKFDENSSNHVFFLTTASCGVRTRKDLGIPHHANPRIPPPDPYFDPSSVDMTHQMITIILKKVDLQTRQDFQKQMELFKSWGKQGDEGFYMELSTEEANEILKQSTRKMVLHHQGAGTVSTALVPQDHQYTQAGEEDRHSRSPSPPRIGFAGPIIKLLTYPPPPEKGGHSITNEDLYCLQEGEFLNDVIIDFYLKYLYLEKFSEEDRARTHIFSSFFYKRLTQRIRGAAIDDDPCLTLPVKRHSKVKTWTRKLDLFKKDFIVIPINEHAHWFLAIVCFPGMEAVTENRFVPRPQATPLIEPTNVPTPPQPTEEEMETEESQMETDQAPSLSQQEGNPDTQKPEGEAQEEKTDQEQTSTEETKSSDSQTTSEADEAQKEPDGQGNGTQQTPEVEPNAPKTEEASDSQENPAENSTTNSAASSQTNPTPIEPTESKVRKPIMKTPVICKPIRGRPATSEDGKENVHLGIKQPCIIIFDSLSGPSRSKIVQVLKEYLQVEWEVKRGDTEFRKSLFKGCVPKVPQQNNYSDCGVFMLQYVESFFEDPIQDFSVPMKGLHDWFTGPKIEGKREELRDLIIELKEKYESKTEAKENT